MKKVLVILLVAFILIQFFPIDKNNPAPTPQMDFLTIKKTPETTAALIRNSCYDCHSNETKYPWYTNVQPFAWFLKSHIDEGRKKLNFSTFATYEPKRQAHKLAETVEMIEKGEMPLDSYVLIHSEAKLTAPQQQELIQYFKRVESDIRTANNLPAEEKK
ncbi:heme-binding domain-containing protein [Kaistella sp. DKR-2]|uniref:heme-binding domain-containing protein n=1 Tax=Kaistella soli TaxID=2849654 RepID=UPI001C26C494|nr:heme-binding domain-containing protein [Kaistella soli]MBU8881587.1 heme-binding domain-containing protein [Kaistella soli]